MKKAMCFIKSHNSPPFTLDKCFILDNNNRKNLPLFFHKMNA